jgi:diguanylate cyclase (GGDEF)-like protein
MNERLSVAVAAPSRMNTARRRLDRLAPARQGAAALRPLSDAGARRWAVPVATVGVLGVGLQLTLASRDAGPALTVATVGTMAALLVAAVVIPWRRLPPSLEAVVPIGFFVVVGLERHVRDGSATSYPPLVMLPIIWLAVYGTRRQLAAAVGALAVTLAAPMFLVSPAPQTAGQWSVIVLTVGVAGVGGPLIQRLVEKSRERAADIAALGLVTRALTGEADPRAELCAAAAQLVGARFAILYEASAGDHLAATAGTPGVELHAVGVDPHAGPSGSAHAWRTGERLYVQDARTDPRASARLAHATGAVAALFQPVIRKGAVVAVLVLGFSHSRPRVPDAALELVDLVAAEIGAALDRAALMAALSAQARTDPLTGAANRRSWDEALERELARSARSGEPLVVALLDIDHFKAYNDACGHARGDVVLRDLVAALRTQLRAGDVVARWGGEEFALALPACGLAEAEVIAQRLLLAIPDGQTASIGLVQAEPNEVAGAVVARADRALYAAKAGGRNRWMVEDRASWADGTPLRDGDTPDDSQVQLTPAR